MQFLVPPGNQRCLLACPLIASTCPEVAPTVIPRHVAGSTDTVDCGVRPIYNNIQAGAKDSTRNRQTGPTFGVGHSMPIVTKNMDCWGLMVLIWLDKHPGLNPNHCISDLWVVGLF
jgi:hypothetical protein